ncbi:hypothetical protein V6N12_005859 [Hibiscus sabdariffa]|uniref:Uncharacterized protein n=1 Tax=Hibiscus sabdariffa TaxID=183260 RepID=A0ABR2EY20_9ROSI
MPNMFLPFNDFRKVMQFGVHGSLASCILTSEKSCNLEFMTSSKTISKLAHTNAPLGCGLCFLNLVFDSFTNATKDSITVRYVCQNFIFGSLANTTISSSTPPNLSAEWQSTVAKAMDFCSNGLHTKSISSGRSCRRKIPPIL